MFLLPRTIATLFRVFLCKNKHLEGEDFFAFGKVDMRYRTWYNKIVQDYRKRGRFGYAWDDGLGMALGERIYNNWITYSLVDKLGNHASMGLSFLLFIALIIVGISIRLNIVIGLIYSLLALGSPLVISVFTHLGKPEKIFFPLMAGMLFLSMHNTPCLTSLSWSILAFVNFPLAILTALVAFPWLLYSSIINSTLGIVVIGVLPGALKTLFRIWCMVRSGYAQKIAQNQSRAWRRPWLPLREEFVWYLPYLLTLTITVLDSGQFIPILLAGVPPLLLYWLNHRLFYLNDEPDFHFILWLMGVILSLVTQSGIALFSTLLLAYMHPTLCGFPKPQGIWKKEKILKNILSIGKFQFQKYPDLSPTSYLIPQKLNEFLDHIPNNARICVEPDGDPRLASQFRFFWQYLDQYFVSRQIDNIYEEYVNYSEPEMSALFFEGFRNLNPQQILEMCQTSGISYFISYSSECEKHFQTLGFQKIKGILRSEYEDLRNDLTSPAVDFVLWKTADNFAVIEPNTPWVIQGNSFTWQAKANTTYRIKYRFHPNFIATCNGKKIEAIPYQPFNNCPLNFMSFTFDLPGEVTLSFQTKVC